MLDGEMIFQNVLRLERSVAVVAEMPRLAGSFVNKHDVVAERGATFGNLVASVACQTFR